MEEVLNGDLSRVWYVLLIVVMVILVSIISITVDLYYGMKKSKELGIYKTRSWGLKKTTEKAVWYGALLILAVCGDIMIMLLLDYFGYILFPFLTVLGGIAIVYTEYISVREKAEDKLRKKFDESVYDILNFIQNNKEIIDQIKTKKDDTIR